MSFSRPVLVLQFQSIEHLFPPSVPHLRRWSRIRLSHSNILFINLSIMSFSLSLSKYIYIYIYIYISGTQNVNELSAEYVIPPSPTLLTSTFSTPAIQYPPYFSLSLSLSLSLALSDFHTQTRRNTVFGSVSICSIR
jgi:hypothetical protein